MENNEHFAVIGFIAIGGIVAMLPLVLIGKLPSIKVLKLIGTMLLIALGFGVFYTVISDHSFIDIMLLKVHPTGWPPRAISVPYTLIIALLVLLPISIIVSIVKNKKPNKALNSDAEKRRAR